MVVVAIATQSWDLVAKMRCDGQSYLSVCVSISCVPYHLMSDMMSLQPASQYYSASMSLVFDRQPMFSVILAKTAKPQTVVVVVVDQVL